MIDGNTGFIVGHTSSTQDEVSGSTSVDRESWENEFLMDSQNYKTCTGKINPYLVTLRPNDDTFRVHPKYLRTLSGAPFKDDLIKNLTHSCPGDIGANGLLQAKDRYQAVFNRHHFDSSDVYLRNITARVDRSAMFMTPLSKMVKHFEGSTLDIKIAGQNGEFKKPDTASSIFITIGSGEWEIPLRQVAKEVGPRAPDGTNVWSTTVDLSSAADRGEIPTPCLEAPLGLISWTHICLEQPQNNPPEMVGLNFIVRRPSFPFPVNSAWPPDRPDITHNAKDANLNWPAEEFHFATSVGSTSGQSQRGGTVGKATMTQCDEGMWHWETDIDRVWANPRQPGFGLLDPLLSDVDPELA